YKIDDSNPESSVPAPSKRIENPVEFGYLLQDILARAEFAEKHNDVPGMIKYYRALAAAVPEEATGWGLLCEAYEKAHDIDRALRGCRYAISRRAVEFKDYRRTVGLIVTKPGELTDEDRTTLKSVLAHLDTQPDVKVETAHLHCQVALKTKDTE